jgi:hypothetical protein
LNPTLLFPNATTGKRGESNITTSGAAVWQQWNEHFYGKFDVSFSGFLINGDAGVLTNESLNMYTSFSPDGVVVSTDHDPHQHDTPPCFEQNNGGGWVLNQSLPVLHHVGDFNANASANAQYLKSMVDKDATAPDMQHRSSFYVLRTILKSASYMSDTVEAVKKALPALKFVDPYTMGLLVKCESGAIDCTLKK